jgi:threonine dehydratase
MPTAYLQKILTARVYEVARETELDFAPSLSARLGSSVWLKREDLQSVFSFKLRGAYNKIAQLTPKQRARGILTASAGNHAQGVALSAAKLKIDALIVVPRTTPKLKLDAIRARGGALVTIVEHGDSYSDAFAHAEQLARDSGRTLIHPFDDPDVIAGQGTIGMEILRQHGAKRLDAIFLAIGGGGLAAGVAAYVKQIRPEVEVIGVQMADSDAMARSMARGRRVTLNNVGLFSDGTAVKRVGRETFRLCRELLDGVVRVDTDQVCAAIKDVFLDTRSVLEPAGALSVAGLKLWAATRPPGGHYVAIACGANMNFDRLRFVAERTEVGEAREAIFAVTIPERRGSFKRFCGLIGARHVTEFNYRKSDPDIAHVYVGLALAAPTDAAKLATQFRAQGFATEDLSHDELAADHVRHLVGGRSAHAPDERLFRFRFPERPGALKAFLDAIGERFNISLFHYRNQGHDYSSVLVGLEVAPAERTACRAALKRLGYPHVEETEHPAYRLFLR